MIFDYSRISVECMVTLYCIYVCRLDNYISLQVFGEAVIGRAGLVIISLLVSMATFGGAHLNLFTAARYTQLVYNNTMFN